MKNILLTILVSALIIPTTLFAQTVFRSNQVGTDPINGYILQTDGTRSSWVPNSGGSGGGGDSVWSRINGIIYTPTTTDAVAIGGSATSSATTEIWFDPIWRDGSAYIKSFLGIGTTSPYRNLSVAGNAVIGDNLVSSYFTATSSTASSTFPLATVSTAFNFLGDYITNVAIWFTSRFDANFALKDTDDLTEGSTNLYDQVVAITDSGDATVTGTYPNFNVSSPSYTAGDGLTRTANDFDCDTASGSVFGCLSSTDWTTFNNKQDTLGFTAANSATTLTVAGTVNQLTSSAGAQDLSANRTWTLSLPNHVIFPGNFIVSNSTTTNATTTALDVTSLLTFGGVTGSAWSDFCVSITGGSGLCDGTDSTGSGGAGLATSTAIADTYVIYGTSASTVGAEAAFNYDDLFNVLTVGSLSLTNGLSVGNGGTGATTLTGLLQGNGTSAFTAVTDSSTVGQILRVTGASTYAWGALDLDDTDAFTGTLPIANLEASTISGVALGGTLANLTATDSTLTFSGTYNGSTARTIGLNLGNANTWTALQTFSNSSTTLASFSYASSTNLYAGHTFSNTLVTTKARPSKGALIGDSTIVDYSGTVSVASLLLEDSDTLLGTTITNLAVAGDTIADQKAEWQADGARATYDWIFVQVGLNDLNPATPTATTISAYQDLINTINADKKSTAVVIVSTMTPAKQRLINLWGADSYTKWLHLNTAIMGGSTTPITGVDFRLNKHTEALDWGDGNLAPLYDTGDFIHENDKGRRIIASAYREILTNIGYMTNQTPLAIDNFWGTTTLQTTITPKTNHVYIPYASTTGITTAYASSTVWRGGGLTTDCDADTSALGWDLTTGMFTCGDDDNSGGSGGGGVGWASTTASTESIEFYGRGYVGIGTSTPKYPLQIASSTKPQLALSDGSTASPHWTMRNAGGNLYLATSSPSTFATSTTAAVEIRNTGGAFLSVGSTTPTSLGNNTAAFHGSLYVGKKDGVTLAQSTSTFEGNVRILGTNQVGDLMFANGFYITEKQPLNVGIQGLILKNQHGEELLTIDENGVIGGLPKNNYWGFLGLLGLLAFLRKKK